MSKALELQGMKFGEYIVIERAENIEGKNGRNRTAWLCECSCGTRQIIGSQELIRGQAKRCRFCRNRGINNGRYIHGEHGDRLYSIWANMKQRCTNPDSTEFRSYGGRGIKVCYEWINSYEAFRDWALSNGYTPYVTIDRINVNGDYSPENCRFADMKVQGNNTTRNHVLTYGGQTNTLAEWADILGINYNTLRSRIYILRWDIERALNTPPRSIRKSTGLF